MEYIKTFLESSTIHGLSYIATGRKYVRLFWILVVVGGFTGAGVLIYNSFEAWNESPVKTTIETKPIRDIIFPKVTVCPPKNTYTDLNYDLKMAENITLDNATRNELTAFAMGQLYDNLYAIVWKNISKLETIDRYLNWYHGYNSIQPPRYVSNSKTPVDYTFEIGATSGTIYTKYFGEKFDADNVESDFKYLIVVNNGNFDENPNVT